MHHYLTLLGTLLVHLNLLAQGSLNVEVMLSEPKVGGILRIALCPSKTAYDTEVGCTLQGVPAQGTTGQCRFEGLAPGMYALKIFHDINSNGKLDTNWIGWPTEPFGFGNDAPVSIGPPSFKLASINVQEGTQTARVSLH